MIWQKVQDRNSKWNEMYDLILQYGEKNNGNCDVPYGYMIPNLIIKA